MSHGEKTWHKSEEQKARGQIADTRCLASSKLSLLLVASYRSSDRSNLSDAKGNCEMMTHVKFASVMLQKQPSRDQRGMLEFILSTLPSQLICRDVRNNEDFWTREGHTETTGPLTRHDKLATIWNKQWNRECLDRYLYQGCIERTWTLFHGVA